MDGPLECGVLAKSQKIAIEKIIPFIPEVVALVFFIWSGLTPNTQEVERMSMSNVAVGSCHHRIISTYLLYSWYLERP